jgi:hypothetical protein
MKYLVAAMFLMMAFAAPALADRDLEAEKREAV